MKNLVKLLKVFIFFICLVIINSSCKNDSNKDLLKIVGNLDNLPDGKIQLVRLDRSIICSTTTIKGKFHFFLKKAEFGEPIIVALEHIDSNNVKRLFGFKTRLTLNGKPHFLSNFMLEDGIKINGKLEEFISYSDKLKIVFPNKEIETGEQTEAYFSTYFLKRIDYTKLKKSIEKYPDSFYLLYELERNRHDFTKENINSLLSLFSKQIQLSNTAQKLKRYIVTKDNFTLSFNTKLASIDNSIKPVLTKGGESTLLILWASWCGPCRQEIPTLKEIHKKNKNNPYLRMVSVSLDEDTKAWKKALAIEKMDWEQFIITPELKAYQNDLFQFDGSIPTTLFVGKNGKILYKIRGFDVKDGPTQTEQIINKYFNLNN
ncbi:thioredoxin-like domain-containing protein [Emticicia sp. 21SJ11W-3]|uniref:TlpA family protein disulfide reductase n=1 Tax=Emticicia sp. 21SJ11W-3 TaxID=2916755 RepID=UPI0020A04A24|nr:thioredoxin-like domain-containing protein [Emticicia sp. 21SJ11W-3]UTA67906.1 redoxin family protein [Emticicia sp. 21SJ11W-3]